MKRLILLVLVGLGVALAARADIIYVQGDVSGTWAADTVMVMGEVRVPPGQTLVIEPGVKVLFQVYCKFIVESAATLLAVGTEADSIKFDALSDTGHWQGIRFYSASSSSSLEYCHLSHGKALSIWPHDPFGGAIFVNSSALSIQHCRIDSCIAAFGGGIYARNSFINIRYNTISSNSAGGYNLGPSIVFGGGIYCDSSIALIEANIICHNVVYGTGWDQAEGGGIFCSDSYPRIVNNYITENAVLHSLPYVGSANGGGIACVGDTPWGSPMILNNFVSENLALYIGGGIYLSTQGYHPVVRGNRILQNVAEGGGGIGIEYSECYINNNLVCQNEATGAGGGVLLKSSDSMILNNIIKDNVTSGTIFYNYGGGIYCYDGSAPEIRNNIIHGNSAGGLYTHAGGGIASEYDTEPLIRDNIISRNFAYQGGGIYHTASDTIVIEGNIIRNNMAKVSGGGISAVLFSSVSRNAIIANVSANHRGGGAYLEMNSVSAFKNNTIVNNIARQWGGGGVYVQQLSILTVIQDILWQNSPDQIRGWPTSTFQLTYSDIQSGWPGLGNINAYPAFVDTAHSDYRLLWGSPCIDTGDPNPIYNDPDGTRADMGAFYYDQSTPVRILLTPHEIPYLIPETGGSMDYTIRGFNRDSLAHSATVWCDVTLPDSSVRELVLGPVIITLGAGALLERVRTQNVPAVAPMGVYHYNAYAVVGSDTSKDSFMFGKLGDSGQIGMTPAGGWYNTGEPITDIVGAQSAAADAPTKFALHPCSPNPFNATTVLSYQLPVAGYVSLQVYDVAGRVVESLVDGWREVGLHEVTFDASHLPSGMYVCRMQAGEFEEVQKMVLLK